MFVVGEEIEKKQEEEQDESINESKKNKIKNKFKLIIFLKGDYILHLFYGF
jgi:hypothetical protein